MADGDKSISGIEKAMRELEAREAAIAKKEKEVADREMAIVAAEDSSKTRPLRATEDVFKGDFPYLFQVKSVNNNPEVKTKTVECCDESEAKRWYQVTTPHPKNPTKQIDLVVYPVDVVCLSPERELRFSKEKRLSHALKRLEAGFSISKEDQQLLVEADKI
jgi:hypothetical protein